MIGLILLVCFCLSIFLTILNSKENTKVSNDKLEKVLEKYFK